MLKVGGELRRILGVFENFTWQWNERQAEAAGTEHRSQVIVLQIQKVS